MTDMKRNKVFMPLVTIGVHEGRYPNSVALAFIWVLKGPDPSMFL
jgi:hypothetical protein